MESFVNYRKEILFKFISNKLLIANLKKLKRSQENKFFSNSNGSIVLSRSFLAFGNSWMDKRLFRDL